MRFPIFHTMLRVKIEMRLFFVSNEVFFWYIMELLKRVELRWDNLFRTRFHIRHMRCNIEMKNLALLKQNNHNFLLQFSQNRIVFKA